MDYSQVELRILAHYSQDEALLKAFHEGQDIHRATAAAVYSIPPEQVTYEQRSFAKSVNFGLMYGMGAFRLARDSDLTLAEAEDFIADYFAAVPRRAPVSGRFASSWRKSRGISKRCSDGGAISRRWMRALGRKVGYQVRQSAEREAVNMPIQGTAADIIKIAMINLARALKDGGYAARMILQVHDELVLDVPDGELDRGRAAGGRGDGVGVHAGCAAGRGCEGRHNWAEMERWRRKNT